MKENWGRPGMPPIEVDVLHRVVDHESEISKRERVWIRGYKPHLGEVINGWSGEETFIERTIFERPQNGQKVHPSITYPRIFYKKNGS